MAATCQGRGARYCVRLPPLRTAVWLGLVATALLAIHVILQWAHYMWRPLPWLLIRLFDVDAEDSFPTWYSAVLLLFAAVLLLVMGTQARQAGSRQAAYWRALGIGFVLLSLDEIAGIHESVNTVTSFSWAIPGLIASLLVGVLYLPFLRKIPRRTAVLMGASAFIFLVGAAGVEMATDRFFELCGPNNLSYGLYNAAEEGLEMFGIVLFVYALLAHMGWTAGTGPALDVSPVANVP